MPAPPVAPGAVAIGDLYVDRATETIWLGVSLSDDPAGVVLLTDYNGQAADIVAAQAAAAAYTDAQIATRAPTVHTHVAADITDFAAAVAANIPASSTLPPGTIVLWHGLITDIGVGVLSGWTLCDGSNGSPDLRDRFIIGAGNKAPGTLNSGGPAVTSSDGSHTHVVNPTVLTVSQIPSHLHGNGSLGGTTSVAGAHTHSTVGTNIGVTREPQSNSAGSAAASGTDPVPSAGAHSHSVTITGSTDFAGGGGGHDHTTQANGVHSHTISVSAIRETVPYMALAYIMKL